MKALIVDDSFLEIELLQSILVNEGIESEALLTGHDIVNKAVEYRPDVILLDLHMPDLDGVNICERLLDNSNTKHVPIIIISADSTSESKIEAMTAGGVEYVTKPFVAKEILALVKQYGALGEIINLCKTITNNSKIGLTDS